jgi:hypothetical protein
MLLFAGIIRFRLTVGGVAALSARLTELPWFDVC